MTPAIQEWVKRKIDNGTISRIASTLEVGSRDVNGGVRQLFTGPYDGIDIEAGPGVDRVVSIHDLIVPAGRYKQAICLEMIEHDPYPWMAVEALRNALPSGGLLVLSAPTTGFPEHRYPKDYWRFMRDAFTDVFFARMDILALDEVKCPAGYPGLIGVARKR
jgi:hypothetical protein